MASHDIEDFIALLDGRLEIIDEVRESNDELKSYLAVQIRQLLTKGEFLEALPGYLPPDQVSQGRLPILEERMRLIVDMS